MSDHAKRQVISILEPVVGAIPESSRSFRGKIGPDYVSMKDPPLM